MRRILVCAVAVLATPALSGAATIFSDNFDSYADTTAMGAVWTLTAGQTLDTANGNPGQSLNHAGTANNASKSVTGVYPGASQKLIFEADIYDDGTSANKRISAGLRTGAGANIIEMGMYNSPAHYAIRTVLFASGSAAVWSAFSGMVDDLGAPLANAPVAGWHRYRAEITSSNVTFTIDLNSDGVINGTQTAAIAQNGTNLFDSIRLGGPSAQSSAGGGAKFDNVSLSLVTVPEPTSMAMAAVAMLGGLAVVRRKR